MRLLQTLKLSIKVQILVGIYVFNYFPVSELAHKDTFQILGHKAWQFLDISFCHRQPANWEASLPQNFKNTVCQSGVGNWSLN